MNDWIAASGFAFQAMTNAGFFSRLLEGLKVYLNALLGAENGFSEPNHYQVMFTVEWFEWCSTQYL